MAGSPPARPLVRPANHQEPLPTPPTESVATGPPESPISADPSQALTLDDATALAFRRQPRLRRYLEGTRQARGASDIAFAPYLPLAALGYSVGGFAIDAGGIPIRPGGVPGFTVLPPGFALPVGLDFQTGYELAELKLQWLICDFGRRLGRYNASKLAVDVQQLQTQRAFQTVANEVAIAYYNVLRTQALERVAKDSVRRAEDDVDVARKLEMRGVIEHEKLLRAEVDLAETQRLLDASEEGVGIAQAALNLAIGLQTYDPVQVVEPATIPPFSPTLSDCLQTAISQRREFSVARRTIQIAQEGVASPGPTLRRVSQRTDRCSTCNNRVRAVTPTSRWAPSSWNGLPTRGANAPRNCESPTRKSARPWLRRNRSPIRSLTRSMKLTGA